MRTLQQACEDYCVDVVEALDGNKTQAALLLDITRVTLNRYLRLARQRYESDRLAQPQGDDRGSHG